MLRLDMLTSKFNRNVYMMIIVRDIYGVVEATLEQLRTIMASANDPRTIF